jgi:hypothetical protein
MSARIDGLVARRVRETMKESRFDVYAAPCAIEIELKEALAARRSLDNYVDWLTRLAGRRKAEEDAGVWPRDVDKMLEADPR